MLKWLFQLAARLPLPLLHGLGNVLGYVMYGVLGVERRRIRRHLRQAGLPHGWRDVLRVCPDVGEPVAWQTITEKRATIASRVGRVVPAQDGLNRYAIWLAGDWLHPRYPATLEAAVQSGEMVARAVVERFEAA